MITFADMLPMNHATDTCPEGCHTDIIVYVATRVERIDGIPTVTEAAAIMRLLNVNN